MLVLVLACVDGAGPETEPVDSSHSDAAMERLSSFSSSLSDALKETRPATRRKGRWSACVNRTGEGISLGESEARGTGSACVRSHPSALASFENGASFCAARAKGERKQPVEPAEWGDPSSRAQGSRPWRVQFPHARGPDRKRRECDGPRRREGLSMRRRWCEAFEATPQKFSSRRKCDTTASTLALKNMARRMAQQNNGLKAAST